MATNIGATWAVANEEVGEITEVHRSAPRTLGLELVVHDAGAVRATALPGTGELKIGRGPDSDIRLGHPSVSRYHAKLLLDPLAIEDCGSTNGIRVGGVAVPAGRPYPIGVGQVVFVGESLLVVAFAGNRAKPSRSPVTGAGADRIVVSDPAMTRLHSVIERLARSDLSVCILGETGVGKEVVAETLHEKSNRRGAPFARVNCAALAESLIESELFGHERGAFTGAIGTKPGLIEAANGGTMLLDEVAELSMSMQAKILRVLEAREVVRVGGVHPRPVDVRFVSATNRDLAAEVARGAFRADLFFRLQGACLEIPPLRTRPRDLRALVDAFSARIAAQLGRASAPAISPDAMGRLMSYAWPGNVRELRNVIERAVVLSTGAAIDVHDLAFTPIGVDFTNGPLAPTNPPVSSGAMGIPAGEGALGLAAALRNEERARIVDALRRCAGNQTRAAAYLGIPRRTLVAKLADFAIPRPRRPPRPERTTS